MVAMGICVAVRLVVVVDWMILVAANVFIRVRLIRLLILRVIVLKGLYRRGSRLIDGMKERVGDINMGEVSVQTSFDITSRDDSE